MRTCRRYLCFVLLAARAFAAPWVSEQFHEGDFPLVRDGQAAVIVAAPEDFKVVSIATNDLAADVDRVTGRRPAVRTDATGLAAPLVLVGTLGKSPPIDSLIATGKLDVAALRGARESFVITTVADPFPGVPSALVIVGSDRRGTAYGVYELSQAIGVSPWYWWADVTPAKKTALFVAAGTRRFGPPSVQYRGIFLNDEDWGLQPWAAKTFEPEVGDIGPKTYAKICELLLRLKANTLWPAMHACTRAFNLYPQNKIVADDYAIVMGSSHAEPMLRNNVTEWTAPHADYNYVTNRAGVRAYWEQRVQENGRYENIYTIGMRGIHDSNMVGPKTDAERIATLEQIFADQRELLAKYARRGSGVGGALRPDTEPLADQASGRKAPLTLSNIEAVPQIFCAYKEVLDLYRQGLKVPDDVTIVWPDDNFGYIRNFASPEEQKRSGGFGVYYHISYLGRPMAYLWLETTPPALIWEEMSKAYDHGAKKIWIVNVGDLKPAEIGTEFFLQMAWDINRWRRDNLQNFLPQWAAREFGAEHAGWIAGAMDEFYRLNFQRKPEHLQWWLPQQPPQPSPLTRAAVDERMKAFKELYGRIDWKTQSLPESARDAFYEMVEYPVLGAALANTRYFLGEAGSPDASKSDAELRWLTQRYNETVAHGKWRGLMNLEPADNQWKSMRIAPWQMPAFSPPPPKPAPETIALAATRFSAKTDRPGLSWENIGDLGVAIFPTTAPSIDPAKLTTNAPCLDYSVEFPAAGEFTLTVHLLPTHPLVPDRGLRFAVGLDDAPPQVLICDVKDGSPEWAQGVLNNYVTVATRLNVPAAGEHALRIYGIDAGVVLEQLLIAKTR
jgi:hypothetical protein